MFGAIWGAVKAVGTAIGGAIATAVKTVGPMIMQGIKTIGPVLASVFTALGGMKPDEEFEDLGDRAYQASQKGIQPENFDSYDEYMEEIRNFELDPEESKKNVEAKTAMGVLVVGKAVENKLNLPNTTTVSMVRVIMANTFTPTFFNEDRVQAILTEGSVVSFGEIESYLNGKLDPESKQYLEEDLFEIEKSINPEVTQTEFTETLDKLRNSPSLEVPK